MQRTPLVTLSCGALPFLGSSHYPALRTNGGDNIRSAMNPENALEQSTLALDEATENLTFNAFGWAFEEAWIGVAWALNALFDMPYATLELGARGRLPRGGSLSVLLAALANPPLESEIVVRMEALREVVALTKDPSQALATRGDEVASVVFDAWALHDVCGQRLKLVDERLEGGLMLSHASPGRVGSKVLGRRDALKLLLAGSVVPLHACSKTDRGTKAPQASPTPSQEAVVSTVSSAAIKAVSPLGGSLWKTSDPFLFCAYHNDKYPAGNDKLGPNASLEGRHIGRDFTGKDNWRMYHGRTVPGFPRHPHRGFETVTVVRSGLLDHSDSMGATARYGGGDVQWLTAGRGIQHAEMFPLLNRDAPNPFELFQIWLNLPASNKMVDPHFTMLWNKTIPRVIERDTNGKAVKLTLAAGRYKEHKPPSPPPNSWASRVDTEVAIWTIRMEPGARFVMPAVSPGTKRSLYVHQGAGMNVGDRTVAIDHRVEVDAPGPLLLEAGPQETEVLLLQGRPIGEPVAKRGPFVMNTQDEIRQAYADYQRTSFGGWPWDENGPVHVRTKGRFALRGGKVEEPT